MRLTWATDIHLDFITNLQNPHASISNMNIFCSLLGNQKPESLLLTGDISLSQLLVDHLLAIEARLQVPTYFVLGNHDFWGSDFESVRKQAMIVSKSSEYLRYLSAIPYVMLTDDTMLVGHDGWYDGLNGEPRNSSFIMNDWTQIKDFVRAGVINTHNNSLNLEALLMVSRQQASTAAHHVATGIKSALSQRSPRKIIVATHVPPFVQPLNSVKSSNKQDFYPWYSSKIMGDTLTRAATANPNVEFEVFCGHCHSQYEDEILPNLTLRSGNAEYSDPRPQGTFDI